MAGEKVPADRSVKMDREKVIKELHDARRYLEDKEWSDRGASQHIDAINDALALLKEQEAKQTPKDIKSYYGLAGGPHGVCPSCCTTIPRILGQETRSCPFCGQAVKWE